MIREMKSADIQQLMRLWLDGNMEIHSFIPAEYWKSNAPMVQEQLLQAEVYVYERNGTVLGFAGMQGDYLAGIFVERSARSMGIGKQLLDYIKGIRTEFTLNVYQENRRAVSFYLREGLAITTKGVDEDTGNMEYTMAWGQFSIQPSTDEESEAVHQMLRQYNAQYMKNRKDYSFHIAENGKIVAGIVAGSTFDTLEVEFLFVGESCRGKGYGCRLISYVEELAARDGLKRVLLNTYSFQAPGFYERLGYTQLFEIDPCFGSCRQFFFLKEL